MSNLDDLLTDLTGGDEDRAEAAAFELAGTGSAALPLLATLFESRDPDRRWWAVRTLAQIPETPAEWLVTALGDEAVEVRQAAALALSLNPNPIALPALVRALAEADNVTANLAAGALRAIGAPSVPALLEAYGAASAPARIHIVHALAGLQDQRAIQLLLEAAGDGSAILNYWAREGLDRLGLNMVYIKPG